MEHIAVIYSLNSRSLGPAGLASQPSPAAVTYRNTLKVPIVARGPTGVIIAASGSTFASSPGSGVYVSSGPCAGVRLGTLGPGGVTGALVARQSPRMGNLEISPSDGVPRLYLRNYLECELRVKLGDDLVIVPARSQSHYDGVAFGRYVPLGIYIETPFFPTYRLLKPYDIIEFGL